MSSPEIGRFFQNMQERANAIATLLLFFTLELNRLEDCRSCRQAQGAGTGALRALAARFARLPPAISFRDEIEKLLHEKSVAGRAAWTRLFDETGRRVCAFPIGGKELTSAEALHLLSDPDRRDPQGGGQVAGRGVRPQRPALRAVTNTLAKDKEIEDRWRGFKRPISSRNLGNFVEDEVVDALISAVRAAYPVAVAPLLPAQGASGSASSQLPYWDRNAPLPEEDDRSCPGPRRSASCSTPTAPSRRTWRRSGQRFFDHRWIDAPVQPGKSPGAFAHPTVPSAHPYLLLNYQGKHPRRDDAGA